MKTNAQLRQAPPAGKTIVVLEQVAEARAKKLDITIDEAQRQVALTQGFRTWAGMVEARLS